MKRNAMMGFIVALAACVITHTSCHAEEGVVGIKTVQEKISEYLNQTLEEAQVDMGLAGVEAKKAPKDSEFTWVGVVTFASGSGRFDREFVAEYNEQENSIDWWYSDDDSGNFARVYLDEPESPEIEEANKQKAASVKSGKGGIQAWLKALEENDEYNIVALFDSLTPKDIEELTTKYPAPRESFSYDLNSEGDGIIIKKFNADEQYDTYSIVIIPKTIEGYPVTEIKDFTPQSIIYKNTNVMTVVLPNTIKRLSDRASFSLYIHKINFPEGLEYIGNSVFDNSSITGEIVIPDTVKEIGFRAFNACKNLTSVKLGSGVKKLSYMAFNECRNLTDVKFASGLIEMDFECFRGTAISELVFPDSLEIIGDKAFSLCTSLEKITFPKNIKSIDNAAFYGCRSLSDIIIPAEVTEVSWKGWPFQECGSLKLASRKKLQDLGYQGEF
jgi:hypothetical protein